MTSHGWASLGWAGIAWAGWFVSLFLILLVVYLCARKAREEEDVKGEDAREKGGKMSVVFGHYSKVPTRCKGSERV